MSWKKWTAALLVVCLLLGCVPAFAAELTVYANSTTVSVYARASSSADVIGLLSYGESAVIDAVSDKWARINTGGIYSYCLKSGLTKTNPNSSTGAVGYSNSDGVKVYSEAATSSSVLATLSLNEKVTAVARTPDQSWYRIRVSGGYGYVPAKFLSKSTTTGIDAYVVATSVPAYASASTSSAKVGTVYFGEKLTCLKVSGNWVLVCNTAGQGWCDKSAFSTSNPCNGNQLYECNTERADIYQKPVSGANVLGSVSKSEPVNVVGTTPDGAWHCVAVKGGYGYVKTSQFTEGEVTEPQSVYVVSASAPIYRYASETSEKVGVYYFAEEALCSQISGDFALIYGDSGIGWCRKEKLGTDNPMHAEQTYYCKYDGTPVYGGGTSDVRGTLQANEAVSVVAEMTNGAYYRIVYNGAYGYVRGESLTQEEPQSANYVYVQDLSASAYRAATTSSERVGTVYYAERLLCTRVENGWALVSNANGQGWVRSASLTKEDLNTINQTAYAALPGVAVYYGTSLQSGVIGQLEEGQSVTVRALTPDQAWCRVECGGVSGYVPISQLSAEKPTPVKGTVYVQVNAAPAYAQASQSSKRVGTVYYGEPLTVLETDGEWSLIQNEVGQGWVATSELDAANPNVAPVVCYSKRNGVIAYSGTSTSLRSLQTFACADVVQVVALTPDKTWCRVKLLDSYGYVQTADLDTTKPQAVTCYVRTNTVTAYKSRSTSSGKVGTVGYGTELICAEVIGNWALVKCGSAQGWCAKSSLTTTNPNFTPQIWYVSPNTADILKYPATGAAKLGTMVRGQALSVVAATPDKTWARVEYNGGYGYLRVSQLTSTKPSGPESYKDIDIGTASPTIESILALAVQQYGKTYVYATAGPDTFDCSGLVSYCVKSVTGVGLKRSAYEQGYDSRFERITDVHQLKRGDIVCFDTVTTDSDLSDHTGFYLGSGRFIHCSSAAGKVIVSDLSSGYYNRQFSWGLRIVK